MDVVLADGTLVTLGGKRIKDVAGLALRLIPAQTAGATLISSFPTMTAATRRGPCCER